MSAALAMLSASLGCSSAPDCARVDQILTQSLTSDSSGSVSCGEVAPLWDALGMLAGRPLSATQRATVAATLAGTEPQALRGLAEGAANEGAAWIAPADQQAAEALATHRSDFLEHKGRMAQLLLRQLGEQKAQTVFSVVEKAMAVWERDDVEGLVLTEMDIEGWIRYASLCHEVQRGGALRLSIASRMDVYETLRAQFRSGDRDAKLAILSVGALFPSLRNRWTDAPYAQQQAWIRAAPLPPPMEATSLAYLEAILIGDPRPHAEAMLRVLGPLHLRPVEPL